MPNRPERKEIPQLARPVQLDLRTKKRMQTIARKLIGSHFAHQTAEAATQQRRPGEMSGLCSVAEWIEQIQMLWANGAESRLELASLISTIRNHLRPRRGDWSSLWESGAIPFSKRKAEKLVVVGFGLGWAINANACSHLPTEWNALYYIARLRRSVQERLIQERVIRQTLSVSQARDLFARFHGVTLKNRSRKTRFRERLRRFEDFFLAELPNCSQAEKDFARARLTGLIELIDEYVPVPYVFSGVRPSSGAETQGELVAFGQSDPLEHADDAAAEDGRTPLNTYPVPNGNPSFPVSITHFSLL